MHLLSPNGEPTNTLFDAYDHAFHLFALSWLYRASGSRKVRRELDSTYQALDSVLALRHMVALGNLTKLRCRGARTPHMHLLEAFLAAYWATAKSGS